MLTTQALALVRKSVEGNPEEGDNRGDDRRKVSTALSLVLPSEWSLVGKLALLPSWLQVLIAAGVISFTSIAAYMVARFINPVAEFFGLEPLNLSDIPVLGPLADFLGFNEPEVRTVAGSGDLLEEITFGEPTVELEAIRQVESERMPELIKPVTKAPEPVIVTTAPRPFQAPPSKISSVPKKMAITKSMTPAPGVPEALEAASKMFNIPLESLYSVAHQESGLGNNTVSRVGSARGLFQFMPKTWNQLRDQNPDIAKSYKIGPAYGASETDDRSNHMKSAIMYGLLHASDKQMLRVAGVTSGVDEVDSYLTHLMGGPGAIRVLKDFKRDASKPITGSVGAKAYKDNLHIMSVKDGTTVRPMTVQEFLSGLYSKMVGRSLSFKENLNGTTRLTIPPVAVKAKANTTTNQAKAPVLSNAPQRSAQRAAKPPSTVLAAAPVDTPSAGGSGGSSSVGPPQSMPPFRRLPSGLTVMMPSS